MSELPTPDPDQRLGYREVRELYGAIGTLFDEFKWRGAGIEFHQKGDTTELIKPVADLPEGQAAWLTLLRRIHGTTHLYRMSRITQEESGEGKGHTMKAGVVIYSFVALSGGAVTTVHSSRWEEKKEIGQSARPTEQHGALLEADMSRHAVYELSEMAPILQEDLQEIEDMLAEWR